jgi:hypothetical protein
MLGLNNVRKACEFYDAVLPVIGANLVTAHMPHAFCYELRGGGRVWIATPYNEKAAISGNGNMVGFSCETREHVDTAYKTALSLGGVSEGRPGPRLLYGPDFYAAYIRDLDGNKMSFVHLGES